MKKIILRLLLVIGGFFIFFNAFIYFFCSDYGYGEKYVFNVTVTDAAGKKMEAANVEAKILIFEEGEECMMPFNNSELKETRDGYRIKLRYHRLRAPIADILGPKKSYPVAFLVSAEKPGYEKWEKKYKRGELYLTAKEQDMKTEEYIFNYQLPNIVIVPSKNPL